jgi:copper chaperone CopZ
MQRELIKVTGMTCGGCTGKVTRALQAVPGVGDVNVSLALGEATVHYDDTVSSPGQLKAAVEGAGFGADVKNVAQVTQSKGGCCGGKD